MTPESNHLDKPVREITQELLKGLKHILQEKLFAVYLYGAAAFPGLGAIHDIDFHVILRETLSEKEKQDLLSLHSSLGEQFPTLGQELDGYYILHEEALRTNPPRHQLSPGIVDESWALHREHMRAGRCIILHGPDPKDIFSPCSWQELELCLQAELRYIEEHLNEFPDYCILNLCRLMYSVSTRDVVVSKLMGAVWAEDIFPEWKPLIRAARKSYNRHVTSHEKKLLNSKIGAFLDFARIRILNKLSPPITRRI